MKKPCFSAVNVMFTLKIITIAVYAEVVAAAADGKVWTFVDTASNGMKPKENRNVISPRMDFDEWTPLGRGDPLKNDPTFDYLPPVLDKVHYWKQPPSPPPVYRAQYPSTVASIPSSQTAVSYNRRFFLTDFSKKEPAGYVQQYAHKRPPPMASMGGGYHYPVPKTPLPMLTPPPYQRPTSLPTTTVEPMDMSLDVGNSAAESKQPPTIRAPPPPPPMSSVRPILSHSVIKVLLENEVDRTTVTTSSTTQASTSTTTAAARASTTRAPPTTDPLFAHYKQSSVTGRPMYLIIQGHSKVKTYGLVSKPDGLSAAHRPDAIQEHNHIGNRPDEPSRRKRNHPPQTRETTENRF